MTEYKKDNPFPAKIIERCVLNKKGSTKQTFHLTLDISDSQITYKSGDSVAIYPENSFDEVRALLETLNKTGNEKVIDPRSNAPMTLAHFFKTKVNLIRITPSLVELTENSSLIGEDNKEKRTQFVLTHDLVDFFKIYPATIPLQELLSHFAPLLPRFYSIASSPKVSPHMIDLLVATFTYTHGKKERPGLGSHFLCHIAEMHRTPIYVYLHPTPHFVLPKDPKTPVIMVGPGTGIAPYRAFLQEREVLGASGKNWLIFGERNQATDYYYESYLKSLHQKKFLRLDCAFSRDQQEKLYVQHLLLKNGANVWKALNEGAHFYICGDAKHMAKDVTATLHSIIETHGNEDPKSYIKTLRKEKRLLLDVY